MDKAQTMQLTVEEAAQGAAEGAAVPNTGPGATVPENASGPLRDTTEVPVRGESLTRPWWRRWIE